MSMHLLGPWFNTNANRKRKAKKPLGSKHEEWLRKNGVHPDQIKAKKSLDKDWKSKYSESLKVDRGDYVSAGISGNASTCAKRGVMVNLHKEPKHVREAILEKASRVMPLYNKGGLQVLSDSDDPTLVGSRSRRP